MEHVRCNLCGADDSAIRFPCTIREPASSKNWSAYACTHSGYGQHHTIVQCNRCGLVYSSPRFDDHDIVGTYEAVEDALYVEEREGRVLTFEHHLKPLEKLLLRTPLVPWSYLASRLYHDGFWYPLVGKKRVEEALRTKWGELFKQY